MHCHRNCTVIEIKGDIAFNTAIHAVAGGLGSSLGGGKFANGAVTGAFGYQFNSCGPGHGGNCFASKNRQLTYTQTLQLIAANNLSDQPAEMIAAIAYKESTFDPSVESRYSSATGLMGVTAAAFREVIAALIPENWTVFN